MGREHTDLLLGEWACLGILCEAPAHGFAVAARLKPDGDVGRVWELSRALTYRAITQLTAAGLVEEQATERGVAGGNRTVLRATRKGRTAFQRWTQQPVAHLRDLRSELLLKLVLASINSMVVDDMLAQQVAIVDDATDRLRSQSEQSPGDLIARWRWENAKAAQAFLRYLVHR